MLILSRRIGETIVIDGRKIRVTLLGIKGGQARIGVDAPREMTVHREEVQNRIERDKVPS
jgi:carbon storage regulator